MNFDPDSDSPAHKPNELALAKQNWRGLARARLLAIPPDRRREQARLLAEAIVSCPEWLHAHRVGLFVPLPDEIDLSGLLATGLAMGKRVGLPAFDPSSGSYVIREIQSLEQDLVPGRFRILEPGPHCRLVPMSELELILVPGLAFDAQGGRLGRGRGFYDRLLMSMGGSVGLGGGGQRWGVGFNEQFGPPVPRDHRDVLLHRILTPARVAAGGLGVVPTL